MRNHLLPAFLACLPALGGTALAQTATPTPAPFASDQRPLLVPPEPVADPEDADAVVYNPAGAAARGGEVEYLHADKADPSTLGNGDALYIAGDRIDFAVEAARPAPGVRETLFTVAKAFPFDRYSLGFGYSTTLGRLASNTPADVFTAGFLARPASFLSLGGTIWDLFPQARPAGLDLTTRYGLGAALRPLPGALNDRLTLAADWAKTDGEQGQDWRLSARLAPVEGVSLYATTLVQGNGLAGLTTTRFTAGLSFSLTHAGAGAHGYWDDNGNYAGSSVIVRSRELRQPTLIHLRPEMA